MGLQKNLFKVSGPSALEFKDFVVEGLNIPTNLVVGMSYYIYELHTH